MLLRAVTVERAVGNVATGAGVSSDRVFAAGKREVTSKFSGGSTYSLHVFESSSSTIFDVLDILAVGFSRDYRVFIENSSKSEQLFSVFALSTF